MRLPKVGTFIREVYDTIQQNPGIISVQIARKLKPLDYDQAVYGYQRATSSAISNLRRRGLIEDVAKRCPTCHRAMTRHLHNVELRIVK